MIYNVFYDEEEALDSQEYDYITWITVYNDPDYVATTTCWDIVQYTEEYDLWYYRPCPTSDAIYDTMDLIFEEPIE